MEEGSLTLKHDQKQSNTFQLDSLFLCSDEAGFITGADYPVDEGFFNFHG